MSLKALTYPRARSKSRGLHIEVARKGMTFTKLAESVGVTRFQMVSIAKGVEIPMDVASHIATALGVPTSELFDVIERPAPAAVAS